MKKIERAVIINRIKKITRFDKLFFSSICALSVAIALFAINLVNIPIANNIMQSLKAVANTLKPYEELFDDSGRVKFVSSFFKNVTPISSIANNLDLKFDYYESVSSIDGNITIKNPEGLIYSTDSGIISIIELDEISEIKIEHENGLSSIFFGLFGYGVKSGDYVTKGQALALIESDYIQFSVEYYGDIIENFIYSDGVLVWQD